MIMLLSSCLALIACGGTGTEGDTEAEGEATTEAGAETAAGGTAKTEAAAPDMTSNQSYNVAFKVGINIYNEGTVFVVHSADKSQTLVAVAPTSGSARICTMYAGDKVVQSSKSVGDITSVEKKGNAISIKGKDGKSIPLTLEAGTVTPPSFDSLKSQCGIKTAAAPAAAAPAAPAATTQ